MSRQYAAILVCCVVLLLVPQAASAHPPTGMTLSYEPAARLLSVMIVHPVPDPATHYVKEVTIRVNGQVRTTTPYTRQPAGSPFTYTYPLDAMNGDIIEVSAPCLLGGSITRSITVENAGTGSAAPDGRTPAPTRAGHSILPVFLLLLIVVMVWRGQREI